MMRSPSLMSWKSAMARPMWPRRDFSRREASVTTGAILATAAVKKRGTFVAAPLACLAAMASYPEGAVDVVDGAGAQAAAQAVASAPELAVDLEADAMHAFRARLCFVQIATDRELFLWDTLAPGVDV